jgi:hypothetical protein
MEGKLQQIKRPMPCQEEEGGRRYGRGEEEDK